MRKAASPPRDGHGNGPLIAIPDGGLLSHTSSSSTTSPSANKGNTTTTIKPPSPFSNLDTSSAKKPKRLKDRIPATSAAPTDSGTSREALTAKESKTTKEHKALQPVAFPASSKAKAETDDEFTPTVFEIINAPVKPAMLVLNLLLRI